ncbi:cyclase family protein [Deinococcus aquatilis]|jgi:arylformamidase|uniref:cyclase family protein n=1 Tax=Deinococcus aquatilis TaxID=519440 RepID=UPI0003726B44|nr:cyclase family protein [Deinococcus aquatilis]
MSTVPALLQDISRALTPGHPSWPGDPEFMLHPRARMAAGDSVNTGELALSTHTGTHVDAPWHYADHAEKLDAVPLSRYVGRCRVIRVQGVGSPARVGPEALTGLPEQLPPRVLLHTGQPAHWDAFPEDFTALHPDLIAELGRRGVTLIGTDSPSVDPLTSKTLDAHAACFAAGILILEGLNLSSVPDGEYDLMCLPMPLAGGPDAAGNHIGVDGAPARAVLLPAGTLAALEPTELETAALAGLGE